MGLFFGSFYDRVAADVTRSLPPGATVLDVGCGPGHLARRLAARGLDVTGLDLDPAMIERARARGAEESHLAGSPAFVVGDAAALPFDDASFDGVVSTLSMHHWDHVPGGIREISRVLRSDGRALVWDLRPGHFPFHPDLHDPAEPFREAGVRLVSAAPWPWPWRLRLTERIEFIPAS